MLIVTACLSFLDITNAELLFFVPCIEKADLRYQIQDEQDIQVPRDDHPIYTKFVSPWDQKIIIKKDKKSQHDWQYDQYIKDFGIPFHRHHPHSLRELPYFISNFS